MSAATQERQSLRFVLDGEVIELHDVDPTRTVLQFLREDLRRTGSKEGCAEGDCGACTVVLAELNRDGDDLSLRSVNACIQFLPTLDGKELITVESLGTPEDLHPVQQAMVSEHGSQCGFCTPGFVMSMFALYKTNTEPTRREIDAALAGNLCRCTGYQPIINAANAMSGVVGGEADGDDWLRQPGAATAAPAGRVQQLRSIQTDSDLRLQQGGRLYYAPASADSLVTLLGQYPRATLLAGGTDVGLWVTKQHRDLDVVIYLGNVAELARLDVTATDVEIGAAVSLSDAMALITELYPGLGEMFTRFASPPIRNAGTLVGNVANGSPIGDSMPALVAAGARIVLRGAAGAREMLLEDFYVDYQVKRIEPGEFVEKVCLPLPAPGVVLHSDKLSKRFDQDISAVCNAYRLQLDGGRVAAFRMACGGMAATVRRARHCEQAIIGQPWTEATIDAACDALAKDFTPISDMRASADYRLRAAGNLLRRFQRQTTGALATTVYDYGR